MASYYEILQVAPDADLELIHHAYQAHAKELHPDLHPDAPPWVLERMTVAMAVVNEAWHTLSDPGRRAAYDTTLKTSAHTTARTGTRHGAWSARAGGDGPAYERCPPGYGYGNGYGYGSPGRYTPPPGPAHGHTDDGPLSGTTSRRPGSQRKTPRGQTYRDTLFRDPNVCFMCGGSPARKVALRQQTVDQPILGLPREMRTDGPFCRSCGIAMFREMTDATLLYGWWALPAVIDNLVVIVLNLLSSVSIRRLAPPAWDPSVADKPWYRPHPLGLPLLLRPGSLLCMVIALVGGMGALVATTRF